MELSDYATALGAAQRLVPSYAGQQRDAADLQAQQLQNRQSQQQIAAVDAQQQEHAAFQSAFVDLGDKPSAEKIRMLGVRFPSLSKGLNDAVAGMEKGQRAQIVSDTAQIHAALSANRPDLAKSLVQRHIDADKAAGNEPDPEDAALISMIDSGDKQQISAAKGMLYATLAAADPDSAAKTIGEYGSGATGKTHVISQGGALVDDTGKELYRSAPAEANALEVPVYDDQGKRIGTRLIENGGKGGGQSSGGSGAAVGSGSPVAGRTQFGWTPRARHGGDNTDAAVDGKIAGMTKALGLGPTDPFPASMTNREVYEALTISEGGRGSIADRNNNRGNLKDPKTLAYRKFGDKNAGDATAIAQVARNRARGQNTIQTMVEGLPVGGSRAASGGDASYIGPVASPGDAASTIRAGDITSVPAKIRGAVQAIADGRAAAPRAGTRNGEALLDAVTAYDPTFDAANATSRVRTRVDFTSGKSAQAVNALNTAMGHLSHLDDQAHDLNNAEILPGLLNPARRWMQTNVVGSSKYNTFDQTKQAAASEMRKVFAGSAGGNLAELQGWEATLDSAKSYPQLHDAIKNGVKLMGSRLGALQDQYTTGMGRSDQVPTFIKPSVARDARRKFGVDFGGQTPRASAPTRTATGPNGQKLGLIGGKWVPLR